MQEFDYRGFVINFEARPTPGTQYWVGYAQVEFYEYDSFRSVPLTGLTDSFTTIYEAEEQILEAAKRWVDSRLSLMPK
jgi:hypothetical protein